MTASNQTAATPQAIITQPTVNTGYTLVAGQTPPQSPSPQAPPPQLSADEKKRRRHKRIWANFVPWIIIVALLFLYAWFAFSYLPEKAQIAEASTVETTPVDAT